MTYLYFTYLKWKNVSWYFLADNFDVETNYTQTLVLLISLLIVSTIINNLLMVGLVGFYVRIADEVNIVAIYPVGIDYCRKLEELS